MYFPEDEDDEDEDDEEEEEAAAAATREACGLELVVEVEEGAG